MAVTRVAHRYATALYESAQESGALPALSSDFRRLETLLHDSRDLQLFFLSPVLSAAMKKHALGEILHGKVDAFTERTLLFLLEHQREQILRQIIREFFIILRHRQGMLLASVESAVELSDEQKSALQGVLQTITRKSIEISYRREPALRGGLVIRVGDTVYDGSILNQLRQLRKRFSEAVAS